MPLEAASLKDRIEGVDVHDRQYAGGERSCQEMSLRLAARPDRDKKPEKLLDISARKV